MLTSPLLTWSFGALLVVQNTWLSGWPSIYLLNLIADGGFWAYVDYLLKRDVHSCNLIQQLCAIWCAPVQFGATSCKHDSTPIVYRPCKLVPFSAIWCTLVQLHAIWTSFNLMCPLATSCNLISHRMTPRSQQNFLPLCLFDWLPNCPAQHNIKHPLLTISGLELLQGSQCNMYCRDD